MPAVLLSPPRSASPYRRLHLAAGAVGLIVAALLIVPTLVRDRKAAIAEAEAWTITGAPCPQLPLSERVRQPMATKRFGYAGAGFEYAYGHVACAQIHADGGHALVRGYPVCQFTSPAVVTVHVGQSTTFFVPGLGRRATVSVQDGAPRCVLAARFYGQADF